VKTFTTILIAVAFIGIWVSGVQFPVWLVSLVAGAYGAWIVVNWQEKPQPLTKKLQDKVLLGKPIQPKPVNPKLPAEGWGIDDSVRRLVADFDQFAAIINKMLEDEPWRLQELESTELKHFGHDSPSYGRRYDVFYNTERVGALEITDFSHYSTDNPEVCAHVVLWDARLFPYERVHDLLVVIGHKLSGSAEEYQKAKHDVENALARAQWNARWSEARYAAPEMEVEVSFIGYSAISYLETRQRRSAA